MTGWSHGDIDRSFWHPETGSQLYYLTSSRSVWAAAQHGWPHLSSRPSQPQSRPKRIGRAYFHVHLASPPNASQAKAIFSAATTKHQSSILPLTAKQHRFRTSTVSPSSVPSARDRPPCHKANSGANLDLSTILLTWRTALEFFSIKLLHHRTQLSGSSRNTTPPCRALRAPAHTHTPTMAAPEAASTCCGGLPRK